MENSVNTYLNADDGDYPGKDAEGKPVEFDIASFIKDFRDAFDDTQIERELAERCRDYYDGYQLTEAEMATLTKRKQPIVVFNRIGPKIDTLLGWEKKLRTDPKAFPRVPSKEDDANSCTDALRFVAQSNKFDPLRSDVFENLAIEGIGAGKVICDDSKPDDPKIQIVRVPWDRFYRDPHSRDRYFADAAYLGEVIWMFDEDCIAEFAQDKNEEDIEAIVEASYNAEWNTSTYGDRPRFSWADSKRRRIMVMHHRFRNEGEWWECVFCRGGFLVDPAPSKYLDEEGKPDCDLVAASTYVDANNRRYGAVKRMLDPQDEINKRRSKALHASNSVRIIAEQGAVKSIQQARQEAARPDGYIEVRTGKRFEFAKDPQLEASQMAMLQEAKNEIDVIGVNPALGGDQQAPSGRAQEMIQSAGMTEYSKLFEAVDQWALEIYRKVWFRVRQYWTAEKWIRVTDDERNLRWVHLNHPVTLGEAFQQVAAKRKVPVQQVVQDWMTNTGEVIQGPQDPKLQQIVRTQNDIGDLDVDIILDDAPEAITVQSEQFQALVQMKQADPSSISTATIIKASSLRNKDELLRDLENQVPPQVQQQMQMLQQQNGQLQAASQKLYTELQKCQMDLKAAKTDKENDAAKTQLDAWVERMNVLIEQYNAETARMKVLSPIPLEAVPPGWIADQQVPGNYAAGPAHSPAGAGTGTIRPNATNSPQALGIAVSP